MFYHAPQETSFSPSKTYKKPFFLREKRLFDLCLRSYLRNQSKDNRVEQKKQGKSK